MTVSRCRSLAEHLLTSPQEIKQGDPDGEVQQARIQLTYRSRPTRYRTLHGPAWYHIGECWFSLQLLYVITNAQFMVACEDTLSNYSVSSSNF